MSEPYQRLTACLFRFPDGYPCGGARPDARHDRGDQRNWRGDMSSHPFTPSSEETEARITKLEAALREIVNIYRGGRDACDMAEGMYRAALRTLDEPKVAS